MNTPEAYLHQPERTMAEQAAPATGTRPAAVDASVAGTSVDLNLLAVHGDPSQKRQALPAAAPGSGRTVAWVRPSELPTMVGGPALRRAADAQGEAVRRVRRAPARVTRAAIARPEPAPSMPVRRDEGLSL